FLWLWVAAAALLLYTPVNPQRRFVEGLQVPLVILATVGLYQVLWPRLLKSAFFATLLKRPRYSVAGLRRLLVVIVLAVTSLVHLYLWASMLYILVVEQPYPFFRPDAELEAMAWLAGHSAPGEVVLSAYWTGSYLPAQTGRPVVVGQRYETVDFEARRQYVEQFFSANASDDWRQALLEEYGVVYVFAGRAERMLGAFDLAQAAYLAPVFQNDEATIYRIR
ncbi:MAG: hypothetical protein L0322_29430, partial [Chloroflexi bacterium]|nr:hypothetical protein [Chloroflexota bacterium]